MSSLSQAMRRPGGEGREVPRLPSWAIGWVSVFGVLALFELVSRLELLPSRYFPPVSDTLAQLAQEMQAGSFWGDVGHTMQGWATGLGLAIALAVPLGIVLGSSWVAFRASRPIVEFLRPVPSVALIPLAILIYGTGLQTKVFLVVYAAFWPLLLQTLYGMRNVDPVAVDTARSFKLGRLQRLWWVTLPSTVPYLATGVRISSSVALVLAVTAEIVVGAPGIGRTITVAQAGGNTELMYALIIVAGLLGWALNGVFRRVERRLLHWHPSQRSLEGA